MYTAAQLTTFDQHTLHYHTWTPAGDPIGIVIIVHGVGEHGFRYQPFATDLTAAGYLVVAPDHRGHGRSSGLRTHFDDFAHPVADLHQLYTHITQQQPALPVFMFGHSMGSGISLLYALKYQRGLRGLVLSGTVTNVEDGKHPVLLAASQWLGRWLPKARVVPSSPTSVLSTDPAVVRAVDEDPLNDHQRLRVGMAQKMVELGRFVRAHADELKLPLLIIHGEDDVLTPPSGSHAMYALAGSPDKTLHTFPGLRHNLVDEIGHEAIIAEIIAWLKKH